MPTLIEQLETLDAEYTALVAEKNAQHFDSTSDYLASDILTRMLDVAARRDKLADILDAMA